MYINLLNSSNFKYFSQYHLVSIFFQCSKIFYFTYHWNSPSTVLGTLNETEMKVYFGGRLFLKISRVADIKVKIHHKSLWTRSSLLVRKCRSSWKPCFFLFVLIFLSLSHCCFYGCLAKMLFLRPYQLYIKITK